MYFERTLLEAMHDGENTVSELRPEIGDKLGIVAAIGGLIEEHNELGGLRLKLITRGEFQEYSQLLESNIFRIVQEALNNVRRYSNAKNATVSMTAARGVLRLLVEDDDTEIADIAARRDSFALQSIQRRAQLFGGRARLTSKPGKGTSISVDLPLNDSPVPSRN